MLFRCGPALAAAALLFACSDAPDPLAAKRQALRLTNPADDPAAALDDAEAAGRAAFFGSHHSDGVDHLVTRWRERDSNDVVHIRLDQVAAGVPVFGGQVILHVPLDGAMVTRTDSLVRHVRVDPRPAITEATALQTASEGLVVDRSQVDLQVLRHNGADHLTWRVQLWSLTGPAPTMPVVFVHAQTGHVVWEYENLQTARDRSTSDANNGTALPGTLARLEGDPAIGDGPIDDAHDFAGLTYDYYDTFQGRDSYDDDGAPLLSTAHFGSNYENAFWDGTQMVYGDGDTFFFPLSGALDVVAHELSHAVTGATAGLFYFDESGGLNEATSDIMAAVIEADADGGVVSNDTWAVGEDIVQSGGALRLMDNPPADGRSIDSYTDYFNGMDVHFSSGIANRAFVAWEADPALTIAQAGDIWYRGLLYYMTPTTTFTQARRGTEQAAIDLFGDGASQVTAVADGWELVDVPPGPLYAEFGTVTGLTATTGVVLTEVFTPDPIADAVRFTIEADNGDADLYIRRDAAPDIGAGLWDCASGSPDSYELCEDDPAGGTTYHVSIHAFSTFTNLTVRAWQHVPCNDNDGDGFTNCDGDCDDADDEVFPTADETCNGVDDNCDGSIDDSSSIDATVYFDDGDGDGFGDAGSPVAACAQPGGTSVNDTDCNDANAAVHPNAGEVCNGTDDDCDGAIDGPASLDAATWYRDGDGDGFGLAGTETLACDAPVDHVSDNTDCDDVRSDVNPDADEVCDPADVDEDCDGDAEEADALGMVPHYIDDDGDGFGDVAIDACQPSVGISDLPGDCDDTDDVVYPGAPESCDDPRDTNCDGSSGSDDLDADGFSACDECDDQRDDVFPGADEVCDGADNNCDGEIDNDPIDPGEWYVDADADGFGDVAVSDCEQPDGTAIDDGDCNDDDETVYPGAPEVAGDGIDQDCDGDDPEVEVEPTGGPGDPIPGNPSELNPDAPGGCGCTSASPASGAWMAGAFGLLLMRRRRSAPRA